MTKFRGIIYKITCLKNRMGYVGQQINFKGNRETEYLGSNKELKEDIKRLSLKNFKKEILVDKFFKNKKELDELETENIIKEKTLYPNGYNKSLSTWPPDLATCIKCGKNKQEKWAKENPELAHKYAVARGKIGGKIGGKNTWKNNRERMIEVSSKGGKIGGKNVWKNNRKRMIEVQSKRGKIGGKNLWKNNRERMIEVASKRGKIGGKKSAHVIFEIDGICQQMTLGAFLKL